jgi:hypothetical protein
MPFRMMRPFVPILCFSALFSLSAVTASDALTPSNVSPLLRGGLSKKGLLQNAFSEPRHLFGDFAARPDTIRVIALRVEFARDTSDLTTGTGIFGDFEGDEATAYHSDTVYKYDAYPHDSLYFSHQLDFLHDYYRTVSRGKLAVEYQIYPAGSEGAFRVDHPMTYYSPGGKKKKESWSEYYERQTKGLVLFVRDAVAAAKAANSSWFSTLKRDSTGIIRDTVTGRKTVFLIIHAGASASTDGGTEGSYGMDTPSDMVDAFFSQDFFKTFFSFYKGSKDSILTDTTGIVITTGSNSLLIDEVMLVSETSNQDNLNWGIHGILVNQLARQIGIPDLFSTTSGLSAVGAFCIMDAGFFNAYGFVPPWPCAWVRQFMGWENPMMGSSGSFRIKAPGLDATGDSSSLLVPINDHEYFLLENRQRDFSGKGHIFDYDTTEDGDTVYIAPHPFNVMLDSLVDSTSGKSHSNVVLKVKNYDAGLPASGVVVWHIDEKVIRDRLAYNMVNADSLYRGVQLVEADGITDMGISFQNALSQNAYDYGGAEDVFPHRTIKKSGGIYVDSLGPFTRPSTRSNDGGQTFLKIKIRPVHASTPAETTAIRDYYVVNYADSVFEISVFRDAAHATSAATTPAIKPMPVPGWPRRMLPDTILEPVLADVQQGVPGRELVTLSTGGKLYVFRADSVRASYGRQYGVAPVLDIRGLDSLHAQQATTLDTVSYLNGPQARPMAFPTVINDRIYVPCADSSVAVLDALNPSDPDTALWRTIPVREPLSTYVSRIEGGRWIVGCATGKVGLADTARDDDSTVLFLSLGSSSPVCALAALREENDRAVAAQLNGRISLLDLARREVTDTVTLSGGMPPYAVVTGDLNRDGSSEIVISDSRQGLWCFTRHLKPALGWTDKALDWASAYTYLETETDSRQVLPVNRSAPSLADLNGDGYLDIIVGGTNGIYAINYKGTPILGWPSYLDNRYWYYRRSIMRTPVVAANSGGNPQILYASPTGENATFAFFHIDSANASKTKVYYTETTGLRDSITGLQPSLVDTLLTFGDSLVSNYIMPGGFIDMLDGKGQRPRFIDTLPDIGTQRQSFWPLSIGTAAVSAPLIGDMDGDGTPDLIVESGSGMIYRWELQNSAASGLLPWPQTGYNNARAFAYLGAATATAAADRQPIALFSYPNPTNGARNVNFKFKFNGPADNVRLDIYTYTGYHVYEWKAQPGTYVTFWKDWNELPPVSLAKFGPGVYRCRLEATVNGKKESTFWKMAVVK